MRVTSSGTAQSAMYRSLCKPPDCVKILQVPDGACGDILGMSETLSYSSREGRIGQTDVYHFSNTMSIAWRTDGQIETIYQDARQNTCNHCESFEFKLQFPLLASSRSFAEYIAID
jgi:hypothetical protein